MHIIPYRSSPEPSSDGEEKWKSEEGRSGGVGRPDLSDVLTRCIAIAEANDRPKVDVDNILYECLRLLPAESREPRTESSREPCDR